MSRRGLHECNYTSFAISPMPTKLVREREPKECDLSSVGCDPSSPIPTSYRDEREGSSYATETVDTRHLWEELPMEILEMVFRILEENERTWPARKVLISISGVCSTWRRLGLAMLFPRTWTGQPSIDFSHPFRVLMQAPSTVECYVSRERLGGKWMKSRSFIYRLHLGADYSQGRGKLLLSATKMMKSLWNCKTRIALHPGREDTSSYSDPNCLAVLTSNVIGTKFQVKYSAPDNGNNDAACLSTKTQRSSIGYKCNVFGMQGPRRLAVKMDSEESYEGCWDGSEGSSSSQYDDSPRAVLEEGTEGATHQEQAEDDDSGSDLKSDRDLSSAAGNTNALMNLRNKIPRWHEELQCWCLDFRGRVTQASVKNFQLVHPTTGAVVLQFGKVGKDLFTMDFKAPFSALSAFATCLSAFEFKLAFE
mmetsp:Transcript_12965/g.27413  ORF Transcript_12965/g.27413 Transcript_12965/m.27413 type:complete len:422 (-) Transcript_12965:297-1562(-)|eukprot:CAMPEP_0118929088 /NCGR_PEP_ID=MMETSP1169-20130426/6185_1 /TAXON_ID=36882 /ORGANISM="Pyramimonas obovata, Strain CCMP722" /LENGTH=421 /DNA_ID=CAMNT_0006871213 /DNA_START=196 /DNA_END=1461 /DNA_ORIENTATION=+